MSDVTPEHLREDLCKYWTYRINAASVNGYSEHIYNDVNRASAVAAFDKLKADAERWRKLERLVKSDDSLRFEEFHGWSILVYTHDPVTLGSGNTLSQAIDSIKE